jgi:hypothetical protein
VHYGAREHKAATMQRHEHHGHHEPALLHTLAVIDTLTVDDLRAMRTRSAQRWHDGDVATPLIVPTIELERSLDVFPFEFSAIIADHVVVAGSNPFERLHVEPSDLRWACEVQARGHLLHLREGYVEARGRDDALAVLIVRSAPAWKSLLENMARLAEQRGGTGRGDETGRRQRDLKRGAARLFRRISPRLTAGQRSVDAWRRPNEGCRLGLALSPQPYLDRTAADLPKLADEPVNDLATCGGREQRTWHRAAAGARSKASGDVVMVVTVPTIDPYGTIDEYRRSSSKQNGIGEGQRQRPADRLLALKERRATSSPATRSNSSLRTGSPAKPFGPTWRPSFATATTAKDYWSPRPASSAGLRTHAASRFLTYNCRLTKNAKVDARTFPSRCPSSFSSSSSSWPASAGGRVQACSSGASAHGADGRAASARLAADAEVDSAAEVSAAALADSVVAGVAVAVPVEAGRLNL